MTETSGENDRERFDAIYDRYAHEIRLQIRRIVRDGNAGEDILQETFIRVWRKRLQWSEIRSFKHWLLRIATNLGLNYLRTRNRSRETLIGDPAGTEMERFALEKALVDVTNPGPESAFARKNDRDLVRELIAELPEEKRIVMELVDQQDLSIRETSVLLDIPAGTVKSRLFYGRRQLTGKLRELFDMDEG